MFKLFFIALIPSLILIPSGFSEEFNYIALDGNEYLSSYEIINGTITNSNFERELFFDVNGTDGLLKITIPKTITFDYNDYLVGKHFYLARDFDDTPQWHYNNLTCDIEFNVFFDESKTIELTQLIPVAGMRTSYVQLSEQCLEDSKYRTDIQMLLHSKECSDSTFEKGINVRDELVCISPESYPQLNKRDYVKTFPILK